MTLRLRLFVLLAVLAALLALGEWALVRKLSADLEGELGAAAAAVGRDVLRVLRVDGAPRDGAPDPGGKVTRIERHVWTAQDGGAPAPIADEKHVVHEVVTTPPPRAEG